MYKNATSENLFNLANKCEHFALYTKGDERDFFIKSAVDHYKFSLETHNDCQSAIFLCRLLVKEKCVRDLAQAFVIFEFLKDNGQYPHYLKSIEKKAIRIKRRERFLKK